MNNTPKPLPPLTPDIVAHFWDRVDRRGMGRCWPWTGASRDYGILSIGSQNYRASRISYYIAHESDPYPLHILHDCPGGDNKLCVNPGHLYAGTHSDNMRDAYDKGQKCSRKGCRNSRTLTPEQEGTIKRLYEARRVGLDDLAAEFGVGKSTIGRIINGHFDGEPIASNRCILGEHQKEFIRRQATLYFVPRKDLAKQFDVSESTINRIVNTPSCSREQPTSRS